MPTVTPVVPSGPLFCTVRVSVTVVPKGGVSVSAVSVTARSALAGGGTRCTAPELFAGLGSWAEEALIAALTSIGAVVLTVAVTASVTLAPFVTLPTVQAPLGRVVHPCRSGRDERQAGRQRHPH